MKLLLHHQHPWNLTPEGARRQQDSLRGFVRTGPLVDEALRTVCGVDASYAGDRVFAAAVVFDYRSLALVDQGVSKGSLTFPYIPGLLSFREAPAVLAALEMLDKLPDLLLVDGHGLAHPRRFGLACHLGVLLDVPTVGVAKSLLVGQVGELDGEAGSTAEITDDGETLGVALRTRQNVRPVYLSVGYKVDLPSAVRVALNCARGYRLPEPSRAAHRLASGAARAAKRVCNKDGGF